MESLAVKYRPKSFAEVIGQPTVVSILSAQIENKTFRNSYLFVGPSGCGKTTVARIFSNTLNNFESEPIEINGASNNGVDNIRNLIIDAQQTAIDSEYKIYIIDEAHQLSSAAWDASLKLIEEPPLHSIFIFCTTNPNKIPETIMSRVQRFDFKKVAISELSDRLKFILNEEIEDSTFTDEAILRIASLASGSVRVAISLLDKCLSYSKDITLSNVELVLGLTKQEYLLDLIKNLSLKDSANSLKIIDNIYKENGSLNIILDELIMILLNYLKYKLTNDYTLSNLSKSVLEEMNNYSPEFINILLDKTFKIRQMTSNIEALSLLNILVIEMCRG